MSLPPPPPSAAVTKPRRRWLGIKIFGGLVLITAAAITLWLWTTLGFSYSTGERTGYVQKLSKKGWLCKTWEGELAMAPIPGAAPQIFTFTVRSDSLARIIEEAAGKQLSISYAQHRGVPTSCFGDTEYFVDKVRVLK